MIPLHKTVEDNMDILLLAGITKTTEDALELGAT